MFAWVLKLKKKKKCFYAIECERHIYFLIFHIRMELSISRISIITQNVYRIMTIFKYTSSLYDFKYLFYY